MAYERHDIGIWPAVGWGCGLVAHLVLVMLVYRIGFHPLAKFPGPFWGKITDLHTVGHCLTRDRHIRLEQLHQKYGDVVRIGPNRISIGSIEGLQAVYGQAANTRKSRSYYSIFEHFFQSNSTHTLVDAKENAFRRRILAQALGDRATRQMDGRIFCTLRIFIQIMGDHHGDNATQYVPDDGWSRPKNMSEWANYLAFDLMGSVCFSADYNMLASEDHRPMLRALSAGVDALNTAGHVPISVKLNLGRWLPGKLLKDLEAFQSLVRQQYTTRAARAGDPSCPDVYSFLVEAVDPHTGQGLSPAQLISETSLLVIAGSDTTASALTSTLFYVLHDHKVPQKLNTEIRGKFDSVEDLRVSWKLRSCHYLRACIDEAMRMSPPVTALLYRDAQAGGVTVGGHHFPSGTILAVEPYVLHHRQDIFPNPWAYDPDRWIVDAAAGGDDQSVVGAKRAFCPFSVGPRACIGMGFAYREMMMVLAALCITFDMRLAPGTRNGEGDPRLGPGRHHPEEMQLEDRFVGKPIGGPVAQFRRRSQRTEGV